MIQIPDKVNTIATIDKGRLLVLATADGQIKLFDIEKIVGGHAVESTDFDFPDIASVTQVIDCERSLLSSETDTNLHQLIVLASQDGLFYCFFDRVERELTVESFEQSLEGQHVEHVKVIQHQGDPKTISLIASVKLNNNSTQLKRINVDMRQFESLEDNQSDVRSMHNQVTLLS